MYFKYMYEKLHSSLSLQKLNVFDINWDVYKLVKQFIDFASHNYPIVCGWLIYQRLGSVKDIAGQAISLV